MNTNPEQKMITPKMERPSQSLRVRASVRAGTRSVDGGVTHTDNWVVRW